MVSVLGPEPKGPCIETPKLYTVFILSEGKGDGDGGTLWHL